MNWMKRNYWLVSIFIVLSLSGCAGVPVVKETDPTVLRSEEAVKQNPNDPQRRVELARVYLGKYQQGKQKRYLDGAIEETREAVRLRPDFIDANQLLVGVLMLKAMEGHDEGLIDEAKREYEEALKINPELARSEGFDPPHLGAAILYLNKSKKDKRYIDRAIKEVKEGIRVNPNSASAHHLLGVIYHSQGKKELALLELKEAVRLNPNDPEIHKGLAGVYYDQGKKELVLSELKEAARLNPDDPETHKLLGDLYGESYWDDKAVEQGIKEYKEVIRLTPEDALAHKRLADCYRRKGLYDLEIFEAKEALRLKKSPISYNALGNAYLWKGDYDKARKEFGEALRLKPDFASVYSDIAYTYFLEGRFEDAIEEFEKYFGSLESPYGDINSYRIIWQNLSLKHIGKDADAQKLIEDFAKGYKGEGWELDVFRYYQGKLTESELISRARHKGDRCEACFYIGYQYLLKGDMQKAREWFKKTLDTKAFGYYEYIGARARLEEMGAK
ncbi:MAG: tetratricopeptide repeat protein [Candidatus Aenigmarchaeota archaeon]|nr:tetratricopeptide repeat protein [Candidatus Aenigmarchaeota archaeon]